MHECQSHSGRTNYNRALAERRVDFVVNYLRERGIDNSRMDKMPLGEELPFMMDTSEASSAINRRVELLLMDGSGRPIAYRVNHANSDERDLDNKSLSDEDVADAEQVE